MAFKVPTMNLVCDIYTFGDYGINPPRITGLHCQWRTVAKLSSYGDVIGGFFSFLSTELIVPAGTDIRGYDENPAGSMDTAVLVGPIPPLPAFAQPLPFQVSFVYDVAKGFTNEYRVGVINKVRPWPVPIP